MALVWGRRRPVQRCPNPGGLGRGAIGHTDQGAALRIGGTGDGGGRRTPLAVARSVRSPPAAASVPSRRGGPAPARTHVCRQSAGEPGAPLRTEGEFEAVTATRQVARVLDDLERLRLVERVIPVTDDGSTRTGRTTYRISDHYLAFWLALLSPYLDEIDRGVGAVPWHAGSFGGSTTTWVPGTRKPSGCICVGWLPKGSSGRTPSRSDRSGPEAGIRWRATRWCWRAACDGGRRG